jgi:hypothetical protein
MNFTNIPADCKVQRFKEMIYDRTGDNPETIRLIYGGKELSVSRGGTGMFKQSSKRKPVPNKAAEMTLMDYGVTNVGSYFSGARIKMCSVLRLTRAECNPSHGLKPPRWCRRRAKHDIFSLTDQFLTN